ncbi:hypothetical protein [Pseudovibrio sp. JE062]|uniref:hypothetical protein n=1 Tax=Pseudovibrio sp. JE062 TaxID=439495 RepID=UPI001AD92831|nr:hypothetical protein [Pseudovibrio sp. JE062]
MSKDTATGFSFKWPLTLGLVILLLSVWIAGFTSSIFAGTCRKPEISEVRKVRACNIALKLEFWNSFVSSEEQKLAILYLERGIAQSHLDRSHEAVDDFRIAIQKATGLTIRELTQRLEAHVDTIEHFKDSPEIKVDGNPLSVLEISKQRRFQELLIRISKEKPSSKARASWERLLQEAESQRNPTFQ